MRITTRLSLITFAVCALTVGVACGSDDTGALDALPPIRTTTTTTLPLTTIDTTRYFYAIKPGDNLNLIATKHCVPLQELIKLNRDVLPDPNNVPAGATIEIPQGMRMMDCVLASETTAP